MQVVRHFPLASEVVLNSRHELVSRLDAYQYKESVLFGEVIKLLQEEFTKIINRQALCGRAIIRSENPLLSKPKALDMALVHIHATVISVIVFLRTNSKSKLL